MGENMPMEGIPVGASWHGQKRFVRRGGFEAKKSICVAPSCASEVASSGVLEP